MERHKCKLCSRTFINGRALGGHMKAHLATLPLPPKKNLSLSDPDFPPDKESECETESNINNTTRRRSKRIRKPNFERFQFHVENKKPKLMMDSPEPVSSVSYTSLEENIAMCLIMLSRDKWNIKEEIKFNCHCGKTFRSSQILSNHKRICVFNRDDDYDEDRENKIFECPFCFKVFGSGQALGGHKRSHLYQSSSSMIMKEKEISFIDLNLPAPLEEEDEDDDPSVLSHA